MWEQLVSRWGYIAVALGTFVEGEGVLLSAGAVAHLGLLSLPLVMLSAALGSLVWGQLWYYLGRVHGRAFLARRPKLRARALVVEGWIVRYGAWLVVGFRFIAGAAIVLPVLIGSSGFSRLRYLALDALGAAIWACVFASAGFGLGAGFRGVLGSVGALSEVAAAVLCGVLLLLLITRFGRAQLARRALRRGSP